MTFVVKNIFANELLLFRQLGYHPSPDGRSYIRRLGSGLYPRYHAYVEIEDDRLKINLHLDQKQASYQGYHSHSGEYEGEAVEREAARISEMMLAMGADSESKSPPHEEVRKGFWQRIFH